MKDKKMYASRPPLPLRACHVALSFRCAPLGSDNSAYLARSLQSLDPYFAPLRSTKHQIYANVIRHNKKPLLFFYIILAIYFRVEITLKY